MHKPIFKDTRSSVDYYRVYKMVDGDDKKVKQSHKLE